MPAKKQSKAKTPPKAPEKVELAGGDEPVKAEPEIPAGLKPSLSYLHGYEVKEADAKSITFENEAVVTLSDQQPDIENPDELVGLILVTTIMSMQSTRGVFGKLITGPDHRPMVENEKWVMFPLLQYEISDPRFTTDG